MFKKISMWGGPFTLVILILQFIPYGRDHTNPPVKAEPFWSTAQTHDLFVKACGDCHSNQTVWPWYSNIAPVSWLIQSDVTEARSKFNVSEWGRAKNKGDEAADELKEDEMPPLIYTLMHSEARLSDQDKAALVKGLENTFHVKKKEAGADTEDDDTYQDN